jgi:hypothetical protein
VKLEHLHGSTVPAGGGWITMFDALRDKIHQALQTKLDTGQVEADGSLALTQDDVA